MNIIGHQKVFDFLKKSAEKDRVSHGYLFYGPEKIGKKKVAVEFAKILQCEGHDKPCGICKNCQDIDKGIHPDFIFVRNDPESHEIEIPQIRELRKILSLSPHFGNYKIVIIDEAQNLNTEAANALLKTLEEPRGKAVLILVSAFPALLPKTINSRLQQIKFSFVPNNIMEDYLRKTDLDDVQQKEILKISSGRPGILKEILHDLKKKELYESFMEGIIRLGDLDYNERFEYIRKIAEDRQNSIKFLEGLTIFFRDIFLIKSGASNFIVNAFLENDLMKIAERYQKNHLQKILRTIKRLNEMISFSNVNPRLCLEVLMLEL